jgi:hypothetical protein
MSALHRRIAPWAFLLRRHGGIFGTARMLLLWWEGTMLLLLQRRAGLARRSMPVRSGQIGTRACPVAEQFADAAHKILAIDILARRFGSCCGSRSTGCPRPRRSATGVS